MRMSETYTYSECIAVSAKLDLIGAMLESIEDTNEEILSDDEYAKIVEVQNIINDMSKRMVNKSKLFITED
jgi:hypothetical protein